MHPWSQEKKYFKEERIWAIQMGQILLIDKNWDLATQRSLMTMKRAILEEGYGSWNPDWMDSKEKGTRDRQTFQIFFL